MGHIFEDNKLYKNRFIAAKKSLKSAQTLGWTSVLLGTASVLVARHNIKKISFDGLFNYTGSPQLARPKSKRTLNAPGILFLVTGIAGITYKIIGNTKKTSLINAYNEGIEKIEHQSNQTKFKIGSTNHGIGLIINF